MIDITNQDMLSVFYWLDDDQKRELYRYARYLAGPYNESSQQFFGKPVEYRGFGPVDASLIEQAIEEDCEQIDWEEWDREIFPE